MARKRLRLKTTAPALALGALGVVALGRRQARQVERDPHRDIYRNPPRGRELSIRSADGTRLHAEVYGREDAPTIVLAHGICCRTTFWTWQIRDLAQDHRVVAYDHRGHGNSELPRGAGKFGLARLAEDLQAVLEAVLEDDQQAVVAGHSMGGITIAMWSQLFPEEIGRRVSGVAFINTVASDFLRRSVLSLLPPRMEPYWMRAGHFAAPLIGVPVLPIRPVEQYAISWYGLGRGASPAAVAHLLEMVHDTPNKTRGGYGTAIIRELDAPIDLSNLTVPAIVIGGSKDFLLPPGHSRRLAARLPNLLELVMIENSGHCSPLEFPELVNAQLRRLSPGVAG
jgi:pimeloyl-ACP methyl ester carboxylesterase